MLCSLRGLGVDDLGVVKIEFSVVSDRGGCQPHIQKISNFFPDSKFSVVYGPLASLAGSLSLAIIGPIKRGMVPGLMGARG